eukprot:15338042-Ditylum_brightwellii.AAC.2
MRYLSKAVGRISGSCPLSSTSIIDVWAKATPVAHQNLFSQQHLVELRCVESMYKRVLVIYLPQIEVDVTEDGNLGKIQPMKISAKQIFHNFDEPTCPCNNFPKGMKGKEIKKSEAQTLFCPQMAMTHCMWSAYPLQSLCHICTGLSGLIQKKNDIPDNRGFDLHKSGLLQVVALLEDCDEDEPFILSIEQCLDIVKI